MIEMRSGSAYMSGDAEETVSSETNLWTILLILSAVTLGVYAVSLLNGFVLDDAVIIVKNPLTLSLANLRTVLLSPDLIKPYYRPLNRASYLFDYWIFGMNPMWYHAANIIIHMMNAILLYLIARRVLLNRGGAVAAALLFAIHPVNSEAVNFIAARNTLLSLFFMLASVLAFMQAKAKGVRWPLLSALLFFCGLLSKETAFMGIALIGLYCVRPLPGDVSEKMRTRLLSLVPYILFIAVYFALRVYSLQGIIGTKTPDVGLFDRLARNYRIIPKYISLLVFPADLTVCHSVPTTGFFNSPWLLLVMWVAVFAAIWLIVRCRDRAALFGLAWCILNYLPIANIVPIPSDSMTERYVYVPAVGVFLVAGAAFARLFASTRMKRSTMTAAAIIILAFAAMTVWRNLDWKDEYSLFASAVKRNPESSDAHYNFGTALREKGDLTAARLEWDTALKLDPVNSDALIQMGTLEAVKGDLEKAEYYYTVALRSPGGRSDPDKSMAYYNLGKVYEKRQRPDLALRHYERFLQVVSPYYVEYEPDARQRVARLRAAFPPGLLER